MEENNRIFLKIVLLGDSGVGKTSLVFKWVTGIFDDTIKPTIGTNHQSKKLIINNINVDVFLWDTAGQEKFHSLAPLYVRQSSAIIIVSSTNSIESQNNINNWVQLVNTTCDGCPPIILALNKIDLSENLINQIEKFNNQFNNQFNEIFYVSALTGEGVEQLFIQATHKALNYILELDSDSPNPSVVNLSSQGHIGCC